MKKTSDLENIKFVLVVASVVFCVSIILVVHSMKASATLPLRSTAEQLYDEYQQELLDTVKAEGVFGDYDFSLQQEIVIGVNSKEVIGFAIKQDFENIPATEYLNGIIVGVFKSEGKDNLVDGEYLVKVTYNPDNPDEASVVLINQAIYENPKPMITKVQSTKDDSKLWGIHMCQPTAYLCPPGCFCKISFC
ncbi:hypothetical protein QUF70_08695 [Desulfobacterales bacterium HSG17]|nr:hypothetical protein [Desulfobacterales bacterium HSG17]